MIVGYARVSTDGQSLEAQHAALKAAGATQIYSEKVSGAVTERKALARAIAALWAAEQDISQKILALAPPAPKAAHVSPKPVQPPAQ